MNVKPYSTPLITGNNTSTVDFQPKMALPGDSLPKLAICTPK